MTRLPPSLWLIALALAVSSLTRDPAPAPAHGQRAALAPAAPERVPPGGHPLPGLKALPPPSTQAAWTAVGADRLQSAGGRAD